MSKTKGLTKLVITNDNSVIPQEPTYSESINQGLFVHNESSSDSNLYVSNLDGKSSLKQNSTGLKLETDIPTITTDEASLQVSIRGTNSWKFDGTDGENADLIPLVNNLLTVGSTGLNLSQVHTREVVSNSSLTLSTDGLNSIDFDTNGTNKWSINGSGGLVNNQSGTSSIQWSVNSSIARIIGNSANNGRLQLTAGSTPNVANSGYIDINAQSGEFLLAAKASFPITINGNFVPLTNLGSNIGSSSLMFSDIYTRNIFSNNSNLTILTQTTNQLRFGTNNVVSWEISNTGTLSPSTANTYDFGSPTNRIQRSYINQQFCDFTSTGRANSSLQNTSGYYLQIDGVDQAFLRMDDTDTRLDISASTIRFSTSGLGKWEVLSSGALLPVADNAYGIGSSSNRVSSITAIELNNTTTLRIGTSTASSIQFFTNNNNNWVIDNIGQLISGNTTLSNLFLNLNNLIVDTNGILQAKDNDLVIGTLLNNRPVKIRVNNADCFEFGRISTSPLLTGGNGSVITADFIQAKNFNSLNTSSSIVTSLTKITANTDANEVLSLTRDFSGAPADNNVFVSSSNGYGGTTTRLTASGNFLIDSNFFSPSGSVVVGSADYAELFRCGGSIPFGTVLTIIDGLVVPATSKKDKIVGVSRPEDAPSIIGNWDIVPGRCKYLRDEFYSFIRDENGNRVLNPEYNEDSYKIPLDYSLFTVVGIKGQIPVLKDQVIPSNWIFIQEINSNLNLYMVK